MSQTFGPPGQRSDGRAPDELRPVRFTPDFIDHEEGSVLAEMGRTRVLCTASLEERVPGFLRGSTQGWITAVLAMRQRQTSLWELVEGSRVGEALRAHRESMLPSAVVAEVEQSQSGDS